MSFGFWFDTDEINAQAEKELKEEHFRQLVERRKAYLEGRPYRGPDNRPWWRKLFCVT